MKKRKIKFKSKYALAVLLVLLSIVVIAVLFFVFRKQAGPENFFVKSAENKTAYPALYSDTHITRNAVVTDPEFKDVAFSNNENMLANTVSFLQKNEYISAQDSGDENGTWLWTPMDRITPEYRASIISGAQKRGIKNIYLSIDSYLDIFVMPKSDEKEKKKAQFTASLEEFIKLAHENGMTVDAEAGWRNWAEPDNEYKAFATLSYAINYNKTHEDKLRGFQYDVEPYLLENYASDKEIVLRNFISLIDKSVYAMDKSDMELSVVIPDFYDGENDVPKIEYDGRTDYPVNHLLSVLDKRDGSKVIVMAYRNFSSGKDGSIDISQNEIKLADKHKSKIIVAQETSDILPKYFTFFNTSESYYNGQLALIREAFQKEKSFGGFATHYVNVYLELK